MSVTCVQPAVAILPPRTSTETTTRGPCAATTSSRKSTSRSAAVPTITRSAPARSASRTASTVRSPPPYCTGTPVPATIRRRWSIDAGAPGLGAVEVDDVQEARAGVDPRLRGLERIVVVDGLVLEAAVRQPHRLAAADVDRRVEDHAATRTPTKLRSSASPSSEDFSGWNCAPITFPRSTIETKRSPYSPRPTTSASSAGRQANVCTW